MNQSLKIPTRSEEMEEISNAMAMVEISVKQYGDQKVNEIREVWKEILDEGQDNHDVVLKFQQYLDSI